MVVGNGTVYDETVYTDNRADASVTITIPVA